MEGFVDRLHRACALALGAPEGWFAADDKLARHVSNLVALHYPPQATPPQVGSTHQFFVFGSQAARMRVRI